MGHDQDQLFLRALGRRLRAARQKRGYTQARLCALAKKSPRFIIYLEQGKRNPTALALKDIEQALKIPVGSLMQR